MKRRERFFITFSLFLFLSVGIFFLNKATWFLGIRGAIETVLVPFQKRTRLVFSFPVFSNDKLQKLQEENITLRKKILDQENLKKENSALKDQFATVNPISQRLIPAAIVGSPKFFPGISPPSFFIISLGSADNVKAGQAVAAKDNVVGKITKVSTRLSVVTLITESESSFTGSTADGVLGVVKGKGDGLLVFENVQSSQNLHIGDTVVTKGDVNEHGIGYPPNLVAGKITSIDKTQSNLFQNAKLESLVNFSQLSSVFVVGIIK